MTEDHSFTHLVVVGSSAGGIEALSQLVTALPEDFPAPVVIAQHLDPDSESHLQQILSRRSNLPVRTVTDHEPLEAGVVYVVPANRHVNVSDAEIDLMEDGAGRPMPSVDRLMESAAGVYGERLVAVVLTGTGTDGTRGAVAVRRAGGTVVVQDPESAEFRGMPGSISPHNVDIIARLDRVGPVLRELLSGPGVSDGALTPEEERESLKNFLEKLREQRGLDFTNYKTPTIMRRLKRRMVATGTGSIDEYAEYLGEHPGEYRRLVNAFLIKVTEFFRDPELFEYLREEILPELLENAREGGDQLRVWSAGCATGEEAYSLAILISEILGQEAGLFNVRIFATDVDEEAVNFARHGYYPASSLTGLSDEQVERYFSREGSQYQAKKQIRSMIVFGEHDLARRSPFPRIDLVMSRNVLIYFTPELQQRALQLFAYSLRDGGYLVLGKAETTSPLGEFFASAHRRHKVYRRQGERFLMPPVVSASPALPRQRPERRRSFPLDAGLPETDSFELRRELRRARLSDESLLNGMPVGLVVVNRRYDIQAINAAARKMFSIHGVAVGEDFLHLLRNVPYAAVRRAIDDAFQGEHVRTEDFTVQDATTGENRNLQISCRPQLDGREEGPAHSVVIMINDITEIVKERLALEERLEAAQTRFEQFRRESEEEIFRQRGQNERLVETNRQLEGANRELTNLNEELRVANEESLLSTEEAQASTEEVETLNEELQATNEELETLNEELQATVEELNTTNDDLQARSSELQDLARTREQERRASEESRRRLEATLRSMGDGVLAVNIETEVLFSNDTFRRIFGEIRAGESAEGLLSGLAPLDENGGEIPGDATPQARMARGESFEMRFSIEAADGKRRAFEARGRPIEDGETHGGVVVLREVPGGAAD